MERLATLDEIESFIKKNPLALVYFSTEKCNVCKDLFPKVEALLQKYPLVSLGRVDLDKTTEAAGKYSVFTIPSILFYIEGSETIRKGRFISIDELDHTIGRYYSMIVE